MIQVMNLKLEKVHYYLYGNFIMKKPRNMMLQIYASIVDIMIYLQFHMGQVSKKYKNSVIYKCLYKKYFSVI